MAANYNPMAALEEAARKKPRGTAASRTGQQATATAATPPATSSSFSGAYGGASGNYNPGGYDGAAAAQTAQTNARAGVGVQAPNFGGSLGTRYSNNMITDASGYSAALPGSSGGYGSTSGFGAGTPATSQPATDGSAAGDDISAMWADMMAQHDAGLEGKLQGTFADEANAGRRMNEMNALGGGGMGGAFAGGLGQVVLGGDQQRINVRNEHNKQGLEMKMARLEQLIKQAEAGKDRDLERELRAEADKTALEIAAMGAEQGAPPTAAGGGGGLPGGNISWALNPLAGQGSAGFERVTGEDIDSPSTKNLTNPSKWTFS